MLKTRRRRCAQVSGALAGDSVVRLVLSLSLLAAWLFGLLHGESGVSGFAALAIDGRRSELADLRVGCGTCAGRDEFKQRVPP